MPLCKWHIFRMTPCLIRYLSIYFERKIIYIMRNLATILLNCLENFSVSILWMKVSTCWNIVEFPKISIQIVQHFTRPKERAALRKLLSLSPTPPPTPNQIKSYYVSGPKTILQRYTEIYRHIDIDKVLQECSSWASRNGAMQMFFLTPNRKVFAGKFVKWEKFCCVAGAYYFQFQVSWSS